MFLSIVHPSFVVRSAFPGVSWKAKSDHRVLHLTFDDGPTPEVSPWVIDTLHKYHAKATFFCLGKNAERYPAIFNKIKSYGHTIGNHTYSHLNGWKTQNREYYNDIELAQHYVNSKLFRPPYGRITPLQILELKKKFKIIMWDVLSEDYNQDVEPGQCFQNVINYTRPGSIIVFHDSEKASKNLYFALPKVLEYFSMQGYSFRALK